MSKLKNASPRFRLSLFQESLWFLGLRDPNSRSFNVGRAWTVRGRLDLSALQFAINRIAERHDILRSRIEADDGVLYQVCDPAQEITYALHDLSGLPPENKIEHAYGKVRTEHDRIFDFTHEPLLRVVVFRLSETYHILLIVKPHLVTDVYSFGVMVRELSQFYMSYLSEDSASLPAPKQFAEYAAAQSEKLRSLVFDEHMSYWQEQLADCADGVPLPAPPFASNPDPYASDELIFTIPRHIVEQLNDYSRLNRMSNYMVFVTAYAILLKQISDHNDIVIGGLLANRVSRSTRNLIGPVVNTMALRFDLSDNPTVEEALRNTRTTVNNAYRYIELPFEKIVKDLKSRGQLKPGFGLNVVFNYFKGEHQDVSFPEAEVKNIRIARNRMHMALNLRIEETNTSCDATFGFRASSFSDRDIGALFTSYVEILDTMLNTPGWRVGNTEELKKVTSVSLRQSDQMEVGVMARQQDDSGKVNVLTGRANSPSDDRDIQQKMLEIWAKTFGLTSVQPDDDFFMDLGGHSLTAMELLLKISEELNVDVDLDSLFSYPTLRELSAHVIANMEDANASCQAES